MDMETAKLFYNGRSQAVRLPKNCRFEGSEVCVKKVGDIVMLYPPEKAKELFYSSLGKLSDDVYEAILEDRTNDVEGMPRESMWD